MQTDPSYINIDKMSELFRINMSSYCQHHATTFTKHNTFWFYDVKDRRNPEFAATKDLNCHSTDVHIITADLYFYVPREKNEQQLVCTPMAATHIE